MQRVGLALAFGTWAMMSGLAVAAEVAPGDVQFEDLMVATPVADQPGDPEAGAAIVANRGLGNCLACHTVSALAAEQFHGDVAPALDGAADRWPPELLRAIVIDAKQVFGEESMMPGFYSLNVGINVRKDLVGKTILTAQEVEDVVAFLMTLKETE